MHTLIYRSIMPGTPGEVFAFHERPDAFRLLTPWWSGAHVVVAAQNLRPGSRAVLRLGPPLLGLIWVAEHTVYDPPHEFVEQQVAGPFRHFEQHHRVLAHARGAVLSDEVTYELPGGVLGQVVDVVVMRPFFALLFRYRHGVTLHYIMSR